MSELRIDDTWLGAKFGTPERPGLLRARNALHNFAQSGQFNHMVELVWDFTERTNHGLPTNEESNLMQRMEDGLVEAVERDLHSVLAFVRTVDNERSWVFYTRSTDGFIERLNKALATLPRVPISLETDEDPEWEVYHGVLSQSQSGT